MSLINDALKRAKEAQRQAPPPSSPGPQLRAVEPDQQARHGLGLLLPLFLGGIALLGVFMVWRMNQEKSQNNSTQPPALTATATPAPKPQVSAPPAINQEASPVSSSTRPSLPNTSTPAAPPIASIQTASNTATTATVIVPAAAGSNATVVAQAPAKPAPLKLQGIVFNPTRPSATISGRTVFVGDRIGEFRVLAIGQDSATLVGAGRTNLLNLFE